MPIIKSPVPDYTGQTGSVVFVNGEGFTEDANHIEWFKEHGYEVVEDKPVKEPKNTTSKADKEPKDKNPEDTNPENKDPEDKEPKDEGPKDKNPEDTTSGKSSGKK
jgi:hypothetical protein